MPSSKASTVKFPLPSGHFPPVKLTSAEVRTYEQRAETIMKNALADYNLHEAMGIRPDYGSRWTIVGNVEHLTAIREVNPSRNVEVSRVFGRVDGDYRNFIDFYYSVTAQEVFAVNQFMFGHAIDSAVLCNIHTKESAKPHVYLGIKWVCLHPSTLSRKRDMCFLEYLVYTKDLQGRDVGVRVTLPLLLDECPPLPDKLKTRRVHSHTVTIARPSNDNADTTQIFMTSEVEESNSSSVTSFKKLMTTLSSMALFADSKHILLHGMLDRCNWTPDKARANCTVCNRKFSTTRRRQHCRLCGEVACRRCMMIRDAPLIDDSSPSTLHTFQVVKTVFCKVCISKVRGTAVKSFVGTDSQEEGTSDAESSHSLMNKDFDNESNLGLTSEYFNNLDLEVQSDAKTSVSSSLNDEIVTELDSRHVRAIAGAEHGVKQAEEEEHWMLQESLTASDFKAFRLVSSVSCSDSESIADEFSSNRSGKLLLMEEIDDEDDVIELIDESNEIVSTTRQIVSSPLNDSPLDTLTEQSLFGSTRSNVSIDRRLQEQEFLLKRLVMAANSSAGYCPPSARSRSDH